MLSSALNFIRVDSLRSVASQNKIDDRDKINAIHEKGCRSNGEVHPTSVNMHKIEERMDAAIEIVAMSPQYFSKNRSPDLVPLTADYEQMRKRLRTLIGVLKTYQKCTRQVQEARFEIAQKLTLLSERSPIQDEIGCELDGEAMERLQQLSQRLPSSPSISSPTASTINGENGLSDSESLPISAARVAEDYRKRNGLKFISLLGLYRFGAAEAVVNDLQYQKLIVNFATNWMEIVTHRIDVGLKRVGKLASDRLHYERKVEALRNRTNDAETKGKAIPDSATERLSRNEDKLKHAFVFHETEASKLCALIEAVTQDGYQELYTLVRNYIEWEITRIGRENDMAIQLDATLSSMNEKVNFSAVIIE